MIYTLTLNPSVDYFMLFDKVEQGALNRSKGEEMYFGGKGINVARLLKELDEESFAIALVGGFTGKAVIEGLRNEGILVEPVITKGNTRINVKINGGQTELNGIGAIADEETYTALKATLLYYPKKGDYLVMSGSVCRGIPLTAYGEICKMLNDRGVYAVVDAEGEPLECAVKNKPWLVKPNITELGNIFGDKINSVEAAKEYGKRLQTMGAENVLVSLGEMGALLIDNESCIYCEAPKVNGVNPVGAGDCMLAGFVSSINKGASKADALRYAVACGSAKAQVPAFPKKEDINKLFDKIALK